MADIIAGPGQGLTAPQALYPDQLFTTPYMAPTNQVVLQSGQALPIRAGTWIVQGGTMNPVTAVQFKDPVTKQWHNLTQAGQPFSLTLRSDGFNFRVANVSGAVTGATVTSGGTGYVTATTNVVPSTGNSRWRAIVGGALGAVTLGGNPVGGANYSIPPLVFVPAPSFPGIPATGHATLTAGAVSGITWDNPGAGYTTAPAIVIIPDPYDPVLLAAAENQATASDVIKNATATVSLTGTGAVTGILLVSAGTPQAAAPSLVISGQGTGAAATVQPATFVAQADDTVTIQPASGP